MNNWGVKKIVVLENVPVEVVEFANITSNSSNDYFSNSSGDDDVDREPDNVQAAKIDRFSNTESSSSSCEPAPMITELERCRKPYKFSKLLSFLDDTSEPRRSIDLGGEIESSAEMPETAFLNVRKTSTRKTKKRNHRGETIDLQRRFVEVLEKSLPKPTVTAVAPDAIDLFLCSLKPYLKALKMTSRLRAQQKMMEVLTECNQV